MRVSVAGNSQFSEIPVKLNLSILKYIKQMKPSIASVNKDNSVIPKAKHLLKTS